MKSKQEEIKQFKSFLNRIEGGLESHVTNQIKDDIAIDIKSYIKGVSDKEVKIYELENKIEADEIKSNKIIKDLEGELKLAKNMIDELRVIVDDKIAEKRDVTHVLNISKVRIEDLKSEIIKLKAKLFDEMNEKHKG